jgi:hypothetical protein
MWEIRTSDGGRELGAASWGWGGRKWNERGLESEGIFPAPNARDSVQHS